MKKRSSLMVLSVCAAVLALSACSGRINANKGVSGSSAEGGGAQSYGAGAKTTFTTNAQGFRVNPLTAPANQTYYFTFNQSTMRAQDLNALNVQAGYLVSHPNARIRLEGNTDNRGSREYNVALGWRRDQTVSRFLLQQGVKRSQIQMVSFGKEKPVAYGNNDKAWALNRRVDLIYKAY